MIEPFAQLEQCLVDEIRFLKRAVFEATQQLQALGSGGRFQWGGVKEPLAALDSARRVAEESAARAWLRGLSGSRERIKALRCKELRQRVTALSQRLAEIQEGHLHRLTGAMNAPVRRVSVVPAREHTFVPRGALRVGAVLVTPV